jgi:DNA-binding transcriptional LysR family regulator
LVLDLRRLRVLAEIAERGSLSAAADALGYTASAVSQQLAALEREAGVELVDRHARGTTLTDAGEMLLIHARRLLAGEQAARSELMAFASGERGRLRKGWFTTAGAALMPFALATFLREYSGVELVLSECDPDQAAQALRAGELDLALIYQFELDEDPAPDLSQTMLITDRAYIGVPANNRLAGRTRLTLSHFREEPWVQGVREGVTLTALPTACRAAGFEPLIVFRTDDHLVVQGLVAAGVGVALLPHIAIPTVRRDIAIKQVTGAGLQRSIRLAFAQRQRASPLASAMATHLQNAAQRVSGEADARLTAGA